MYVHMNHLENVCTFVSCRGYVISLVFV